MLILEYKPDYDKVSAVMAAGDSVGAVGAIIKIKIK